MTTAVQWQAGSLTFFCKPFRNEFVVVRSNHFDWGECRLFQQASQSVG